MDLDPASPVQRIKSLAPFATMSPPAVTFLSTTTSDTASFPPPPFPYPASITQSVERGARWRGPSQLARWAHLVVPPSGGDQRAWPGEVVVPSDGQM